MKRILLINTGGTFSSRPGPSGLAPELTGEEITAQDRKSTRLNSSHIH